MGKLKQHDSIEVKSLGLGVAGKIPQEERLSLVADHDDKGIGTFMTPVLFCLA